MAKKRLSERVRADHPICAYCGGGGVTEQADHVPPIAMFSLKRRPEGLEFPACGRCHEGTRRIDSVAALTARSWPNLASEEERQELGELMRGVLRFVPPVAHELAMGFATDAPVPDKVQAAVGPSSPVIVMDFTVRRAILEAFGARIGLAFHYMETGQVLPEEGAVWCRAYTNVENIQGEALPGDLGAALGSTFALMQKGLRAEDDFQFATRRLDDYNGVVSFASFRQSFAILTATYASINDFPSEVRGEVFRPGFLIGYPL